MLFLALPALIMPVTVAVCICPQGCCGNVAPAAVQDMPCCCEEPVETPCCPPEGDDCECTLVVRVHDKVPVAAGLDQLPEAGLIRVCDIPATDRRYTALNLLRVTQARETRPPLVLPLLI